MIYPAVVMKVIGYPDQNNKIHKYPIEGQNIIRCLLDNGDIINISMYGNDTEMNSLKDYLESKSKQNIKENKKKTIMSDIAFSDNNFFDNKIEEIKKSNNLGSDAKSNQKAIEIVAMDFLNESTRIKQSSIIRMALAKGENGYNSRSIISKLNKEGIKIYSQTGIYQHAINSNSIPIEIQRVVNQDNIYSFYQVKTSKLINAEQIKLLLDHSLRTIEKTREKPFLPKFIFMQDTPNHLKNKLIQFNALSKDKNNINVDNALTLLNEIKLIFINENLYKFFQMNLPILIDEKVLNAAINTIDNEKGKSPFQSMRDAIINLNFGSQNPERKKELKNIIYINYLNPILEGKHIAKLLLTYNIVAPNIFGESDSWGYMVNNVDFSKLTLEISEQDRIIKYLESLI